MRIERQYKQLDDTEEIRIYDITEREFFHPAPKEYEITQFPFEKTTNNINIDLDIFVPIDDGEDYIVHHLGRSALIRGNVKLNDVVGRRLSKTSPGYYKILKEPFKEVYKTHKTKKMIFFYHFNEKLARFSNIKILWDMEKVILISDHRNNRDTSSNVSDDAKYDEKANLIEYFSQTGSYYKINDRYSWTQGVYNILNRSREENDEYYNIVFDLVIPEDKPMVEKILKEMDGGHTHSETIIRIRTNDGSLKYIEVNLYSKFDENDELISRYGLLKDVSTDSTRKMIRPIDFLFKGFKNSKKLALIIDPLNPKHYEFSEGFYSFIEEDHDTYIHSQKVIENIDEEDVKLKIKDLIDGKTNEITERFTYNVHGDKNNQKIAEIHLEKFEFSDITHSIGFITDITEDRKKQEELIEAYDHQTILIKEVHHRVKNNLQVLNSFLNLEKRAYKDQPEMIIDHMQSRLTSLAILHEKTYNTTDFKNINLKEYITDQDGQLRNLIGLKDKIEFESEVDDDLNLTIEVITPLLLVIDELTMNAIKHAFPDKSMPNKKISKSIHRLDENYAQLIIKDNGVGIENPRETNTNLGCEIIKSLTKQLDGKIELLNQEKGTAYRLTFPIVMEHTIEG